MGTIGFDNEKYLEEQRHYILERVAQNDGKLYLECGGKLLFDYHASRVLPGFDPNVKMRVFQSLKDQIDVIICIHAGDIERRKMRSDFGITYDTDVFKMIDDFSKWGLKVTRVVITRFDEEPGAVQFKNLLEQRGITVYTHHATHGYPNNVDLIVSEGAMGQTPTYLPIDRLLLSQPLAPVPASSGPAFRRCTMTTRQAGRVGIQSLRPSLSGICPSIILSI